jgi:hypothetical protein
MFPTVTQEMAAEELEQRHRHSAKGSERLERPEGLHSSKIDKSRHFSYYSFEGATG